MEVSVLRCPSCGAPVAASNTVCDYCGSQLLFEMETASTVTPEPSQSPSTSPAAGDTVLVAWNGSWYPAVIRQTGPEGYLVHYTDWSDSWDEWVPENRLRLLDTDFAPGDVVEVRWLGMWYAAEVQQVQDGQYYIHYRDHGDSWDEWVGPDRIRRPGG